MFELLAAHVFGIEMTLANLAHLAAISGFIVLFLDRAWTLISALISLVKR